MALWMNAVPGLAPFLIRFPLARPWIRCPPPSGIRPSRDDDDVGGVGFDGAVALDLYASDLTARLLMSSRRA